MKRRSWSSAPLCTQSLGKALPLSNALGLDVSNRTFTGPASSSAFSSSHPEISIWSVMSLYPLGTSAPVQDPEAVLPPSPALEPAFLRSVTTCLRLLCSS